jgi:hypothetical protein
MENTPLGIETLKKALGFMLGLGTELASALEDGKVSMAEGLGFIDNLFAIPGLVKDRKQLVDELKNLSDDERQELFTYAAQEFDLANDEVESVVEQALATAQSILELAISIKDLKNKS